MEARGCYNRRGLYRLPPIAGGFLLVIVLVPSAVDAADHESLSLRAIDATDGAPIEGCIVRNGDYLALSQVVGTTDRRGDCKCMGIRRTIKAPSSFTVGIVQDDFWISRSGYVAQHINRRDCGESGATGVVVRMNHAHPCHGRVVRADGTPVANEPALLIGAAENWPIQHQLSTDSQGAFSWSDAPEGRIYIAMGVDGRAHNAVFQELDTELGNTVVRVPIEWRGGGGESGTRLLYLRKSNGGHVLPELWSVGNRAVPLLSVLRSQRTSIDHVVVSYSGEHSPVSFFATGGKNRKLRLEGELMQREPRPTSRQPSNADRP